LITRASSEGGGLERKCRPVSLDELGIRHRSLAGELEELRHRVEADDLSHEGRQCERERACTSAHVEGALVAVRPDEVADLVGEPRGSCVLSLRDTLRRPREAVSH
jgi:hypothetical protein